MEQSKLPECIIARFFQNNDGFEFDKVVAVGSGKRRERMLHTVKFYSKIQPGVFVFMEGGKRDPKDEYLVQYWPVCAAIDDRTVGITPLKKYENNLSFEAIYFPGGPRKFNENLFSTNENIEEFYEEESD